MKKRVIVDDLEIVEDKKDSKFKSFIKNLEYSKTIKRFLLFFVSILFLEFMFSFFIFDTFYKESVINIFLYSLMASSILSLLSGFFKSKGNRIVISILLGILGFLFCVQLVFYSAFKTFFSFTILGLGDQIESFIGQTIKIIIQNIFYIIILFLPFILYLIFKKKWDYGRSKINSYITYVLIFCVSLSLFIFHMNKTKKVDSGTYSLYHDVNSIELNIEKLGVLNSYSLDVYRAIFGFEEKIVEVKEEKKVEDTIIKYEKNTLEINFDKATSNNEIKKINDYMKNEEGTDKNQYTGLFKDYNLIYITAESFSQLGVSEELTPTLYKLTHEGFVFNNYYSPTISSTLGGEFQELSGLYPANGFVNIWKSGKNTYPMGLGTVFREAGYNTFAYHDHWYKFQDRHNYLKALGFTNYKGCGNGMGDIMNCNQWPEDDVEMINVTFDDYINSDKPFMVFYAAVSGHGNYSWSGNNMSRKNKDLVKDLPYSQNVKAYIAAQIQFDRALGTLINKLEEAGKLDDTIIAFAADHYPYMLTIDEVNEAATYKKDSVVEVNHSNFVLWNSAMEKVEIDKVGSTIDVIPTIYNVMGIPYDSRLFIGKDILSTEPGLAIFGNRSWVSDYGTYFAGSKKFVPKDGVEVPEDYVSNMNKIVSNKIAMSGYILSQNYYKKVLGD